MKFKVGDKVTIRKDLSRDEYNVVSDMEEYRGKVATIVELRDDGNYLIDLDDRWWYWDDSMFEESKEEKEKEDEVENKTENEKFRAFLNEVARGDKSSDSYYFITYSKLYDVVLPNDDLSENEVSTLIDEIVEFYSNFEPKPTPKPKKMTLKEIEEKFGYKIELVED